MYCSAAYYWLYAVIQSKKNTSGNVVIVVTPARDGAPAKTMSKNDYDMMHLGEMFQVSSAPRRRALEPVRTALEPERVRRACAALDLPVIFFLFGFSAVAASVPR